jgi:hypothetical protein
MKDILALLLAIVAFTALPAFADETLPEVPPVDDPAPPPIDAPAAE